MRLFGTSGIRRLFDRELVEIALRVGLAVGANCRKVVVGTDTRTSGAALKQAVLSGLLAAGVGCYDAGVLPTPTLAFATCNFDAGIMLTASHNPPEYNGLKLLNPDGSSYTLEQQEKLEALILDDSLKAASWTELKSSACYEGAVEEHMTRILQDFPEKRKIKVVVDCGCGAASVITPCLLERMGCNVIALNSQPSGFFPHDIEPVEANLTGLMKAVRESGAVMGIAHDGDADRMMLVDDKGRFVSGDRLLVMLARALKARDVVTTIDASMAVDEAGFAVRRTVVGDTAVSEELRRGGGGFGGEPSGAWVFPEISLCPDGIYAAARAAAIASQCKVSELVDSIPIYPIKRGNVAGKAPADLATCLMAMSPLSVSNTDGVKLNFKDGWLLVRASGTEPKIRLTAEAKTEAWASRLYETGEKIVKSAIKGGS
ncbi:MAG: phosphoglucosamine mutase [Dehalococcoidales bacterium]|nr:phosphoglucosamine mutase [Dehalococcoidales bacterium]